MTSYAALAERLDLPVCESEAGQIMALQARRREQLEALEARDPAEVTTASLIRLRATQAAEVQLCEQALTELGAPFEAAGLGAVRS